uniref:ANK_REP_REGION domain-containing protein n=1 Tax=Heterorhabditis bacteriophora TaxID=37862 RepID=A0A1I7X2V2_HETBA
MAPEPKKGDCLVSRAVPCVLSNSAQELAEKLEQLTVEETTSEKKLQKVANNISPSDFVTLQSIRSSALARKTNTTSKFSRGGPALFNDLLNKDDTSIKLLCSSRSLRINAANGRGQTALHCAIKNHGVIDERTQKFIDNKPVVATLLKAGADPTIIVSHLIHLLYSEISVFSCNIPDSSIKFNNCMISYIYIYIYIYI